MRIARLSLAVFLLAAACLLGSPGQVATAQNVPDIDELLNWQDDLVLRRYQQSFLSDRRWDVVQQRVWGRLNGHIEETFPRFKPVACYVFVCRMGFNAQTWNRIIVFDSLLLDALHNLANGIAVYGTTNCQYVQTLAQYVAQTDKACKSGRLLINLASIENPYMLPTIWGLTAAQRARSEALFEQMLASWMAHEGSHAFLDHTRERVEVARLQQMYRSRNQTPPDEVRKYIDTYMSYDMSRQKEREADEFGIRLAVRSGYGIEGLLYSFEFAQMIEELTGESSLTYRTHPTPLERADLARQIAAEEARRQAINPRH